MRLASLISKKSGWWCLTGLMLWCHVAVAQTQPLHIAVAANFATPAKQIAQQFTDQYHIPTQITVASSGTLFVQITHGAPFDVFLSADTRRPQQLIEQHHARPDSLRTYAYGRLIYLTRDPAPQSVSQLSQQLQHSNSRLALANPRLAPYGLAAKQTLQTLQLWNNSTLTPVLGKNVLQATQYFRLNTVNHALVAASHQPQGQYQQFLIPPNLHDPIVQQLVITANTKELASARKFVRFMLSAPIQRKLHQWGYQCVLKVCQ
ncbi:molybdate ABC transporter substrate-binding protein [Alteromonas lipotrueiana]|uniref:molybdate ABC transporter substrate-binding protein n=1 Tax=Alteromonas lipotrueiana TaxID=2803815 RepID=UPI001C478D66|nr:molybdate ABC transporter substrate-binding protein [Alteromonas lipotrueiana]